jgi:hypothetical protein
MTMSNRDSYQALLAAVQAFHDKQDCKNTGGEELGEISSCVTMGKDTEKLAEECADLFIQLAPRLQPGLISPPPSGRKCGSWNSANRA